MEQQSLMALVHTEKIHHRDRFAYNITTHDARLFMHTSADKAAA